MQNVRCGLIGYGAWGTHHARALSSIPGATLTAICARSAESAGRARADHQSATIHTDYRRMLEVEQLDLCDVVLPSHLHYEVSRAVLESGRDLLLEKPMALTLSDCSALCRIAAERSRILAIGHELRMSSLWGKVKQIIDAGDIGTPMYALIDLWRKPYRLGADGWRYDIGRVGSWILEEPIHFFDLARWYFSGIGDPTSVYASASAHRPEKPELNDDFSAILAFPGGQHAVITQTLAGWEHHQTARITGTNGAIWASWSGAMDRTFEPSFHLKVRRGDAVEQVPIAKPSGEVYELVDQVAAVVDAVRTRGSPPCTGDDGWWSTAMCLRAEESMRTGKPVVLDKGAAC